tara:strand:+ start:201 stop:887 length:687 start_codon:yes stop_codon:yes gene_type:complete
MSRKKRNKNHYFTKVHEHAIIDYTNSNDIKIRTELYVAFICPAFSEMVDKIVYTYKFTSLPNIDVLKDECKIWLTTILDKYDPNRGSKAFSYFSVITKNWFIHKVKKNTIDNKREIHYDDLSKKMEASYLSTSNEYIKEREEKEFWNFLQQEINSWEVIPMKINEKKVYEAVKMILSSSDQIQIFNKKAVYLYIREITGLNTKQVVNNLNKMRERYGSFKKKWNEGKI